MAIKEILEKLGMTKNEVLIYITLLHHGELNVNELGAKAGLHRPGCYDIIERLLDKGFVSYILKDNKKHFKAVDPEKLLEYLEERKEEVKNILPQLHSMQNSQQEETQVEIIKGRKVLSTILKDVFKNIQKTKKPLLAMGIEEEKFLTFDELAIKKHIANLQKKKLKEKLLAKKSAKTFFKGSQSIYRLIPDHLFNPNPTHIYEDKVASIVWGQPTYGIIIKSKALADANRKYFEILWKTAKPKKK